MSRLNWNQSSKRDAVSAGLRDARNQSITDDPTASKSRGPRWLERRPLQKAGFIDTWSEIESAIEEDLKALGPDERLALSHGPTVAYIERAGESWKLTRVGDSGEPAGVVQISTASEVVEYIRSVAEDPRPQWVGVRLQRYRRR